MKDFNNIRRAEQRDIPAINSLLCQVLMVHAKLRPDIFIPGTKKYTDEELIEIINDDTRPIFVYQEGDEVIGYAFCILKETKGVVNIYDNKEVYIDDICIDEAHRGKHVASALYEYVVDFAEREGFDKITLNVWEGNDAARKFYEKMGMKPLKTVMEAPVNKKN